MRPYYGVTDHTKPNTPASTWRLNAAGRIKDQFSLAGFLIMRNATIVTALTASLALSASFMTGCETSGETSGSAASTSTNPIAQLFSAAPTYATADALPGPIRTVADEYLVELLNAQKILESVETRGQALMALPQLERYTDRLASLSETIDGYAPGTTASIKAIYADQLSEFTFYLQGELDRINTSDELLAVLGPVLEQLAGVAL